MSTSLTIDVPLSLTASPSSSRSPDSPDSPDFSPFTQSLPTPTPTPTPSFAPTRSSPTTSPSLTSAGVLVANDPSASISLSTSGTDTWTYTRSGSAWIPYNPATETVSISTSGTQTYTFVRSGSAWIPSASAANSTTETAQMADHLPIPAIVGLTVTITLLAVSGIVAFLWFKHRRNKQSRVAAREMREVGREEGTWPFGPVDAADLPRPAAVAMAMREEAGGTRLTRADVADTIARPTRLRGGARGGGDVSDWSSRDSSSAWEDDSEMDALANDGSTLARTLSTRSSASGDTITATQSGTLVGTFVRSEVDHPGLTYPAASAAGSSSLPGWGRISRAPSTHRPTPPSSTTTSPFDSSPHARAGPPRAVSRASTISENPFQDPLPVYTLTPDSPPRDARGVTGVGAFGTVMSGAEAARRALLPRLETDLPPPAYGELSPRVGR